MNTLDFDAEALLDEAIAEYLVAADEKRTINEIDFLNRYAKIREPLLQFIKDQEAVGGHLAHFQSSARPKSTENEVGPNNATIGRFVPKGENKKSAFPEIAGYGIQKVLGKGGMGIVYLAKQIRGNRLVALKMILSPEASENELERFQLEAQTIANINHPNVIQIYEIGEHNGYPFFALEYCNNGSLAQQLKDNPLSPQIGAKLVKKLANAMHAAHEQQVIHRDLKPANILIGQNQEPKITDFGLAKKLDDENGRTQTDAIMGTPSYMAPEQAFGETSKATASVDIYSLGVILYEALTGRVPFRGVTIPDTLDQVRKSVPIPVRQLQPKVPRDLETITMKCLQKEPQRRYPSALALAEDLERFIEGRAIVARPVGSFTQLKMWCKRNPLIAILTTTIFFVLTIGLVSTLLALRQSQQNYETSEENFQEAFKAVDESFTKISEDTLLSQPGMEPLRLALLSASQPYWERFAQKRKDDPSVRQQLATAHIRLALIYNGRNDRANTTENLNKALILAGTHLQEKPDDLERLRSLAGISLNAGWIMNEQNQSSAAESHYQTSIQTFEKVVAADPSDLRSRRYLAETRFRVADLQSKYLPPEQVLLTYQAAFNEFTELANQNPTDDLLFQAASLRVILAQFVLLRLNRPLDAIQNLEIAKKSLIPLSKTESSTRIFILRDLMAANSLLSACYFELSKNNITYRTQAISLMEQATKEGEQLLQFSSGRYTFRRDLMQHLLRSFQYLETFKENQQATQVGKEAIRHLKILMRTPEGFSAFSMSFLDLNLKMADLTEGLIGADPMKEKRYREIETFLSDALEIMRATNQTPNEAQKQVRATVYFNRGRTRVLLTEFTNGISDFDEALKDLPANEFRNEVEAARKLAAVLLERNPPLKK